MASLQDIEKILNPADPTLTGMIPVGSTIAQGITGLAGTQKATGNNIEGLNSAVGTVKAAGAAVPGIADETLAGQKELYSPYVKAGIGALSDLTKGVSPGGGLTDPFQYDHEDLVNDPAYQFTLSEGLRQAHAALGAQGIDYSGGAGRQLTKYATGLADTTYDKNYSRAEQTFRANQQNRIKALADLSGQGLTAANAESGAIGQAGATKVQGAEWSATQIADLMAQLGDARAAGNLGAAQQIQNTLAGIAQQVGGNAALKKILDGLATQGAGAVSGGLTEGSILGGTDPYTSIPGGAAASLPSDAPQPGSLSQIVEAPNIAGALGGYSGLGELGGIPGGTVTATSTIPTLASVGEVGGGAASGSGIAAALGGAESAATSIPGGAAASLPGAAPEVAGWTAPGGGLGHAALSFLTNPLTIGIGAAIIGTIALLKSQAHWEANTWVNGFQKPFDSNMAKLSDQFFKAAQSGQMTKEQAVEARNQADQAMIQYRQKLDKFYREKGTNSDQSRVGAQAFQTFIKNYGQDGQGYLGRMDQAIAQMQEAA